MAQIQPDQEGTLSRRIGIDHGPEALLIRILDAAAHRAHVPRQRAEQVTTFAPYVVRSSAHSSVLGGGRSVIERRSMEGKRPYSASNASPLVVRGLADCARVRPAPVPLAPSTSWCRQSGNTRVVVPESGEGLAVHARLLTAQVHVVCWTNGRAAASRDIYADVDLRSASTAP